jgi:hypothetical protein
MASTSMFEHAVDNMMHTEVAKEVYWTPSLRLMVCAQRPPSRHWPNTGISTANVTDYELATGATRVEASAYS